MKNVLVPTNFNSFSDSSFLGHFLYTNSHQFPYFEMTAQGERCAAKICQGPGSQLQTWWNHSFKPYISHHFLTQMKLNFTMISMILCIEYRNTTFLQTINLMTVSCDQKSSTSNPELTVENSLRKEYTMKLQDLEKKLDNEASLVIGASQHGIVPSFRKGTRTTSPDDHHKTWQFLKLPNGNACMRELGKRSPQCFLKS